MKPPPFGYLRPTSLEAALVALAELTELGEEARPLAGGQSLVPMLNFRLARPGVLVDLGRIDELQAVRVTESSVQLGAMARQSVVERDPSIRAALPLLATALGHVGHPQIRNRGTIGGSIVHADPAAELPAVVLALGGTLEVASAGDRRTIAADDAFLGPFQTALEPGELLTGVSIARGGLGRWGFQEIARRHGDYALAGLVAVERDGAWRLVAFGMGWTPVRLMGAESALRGGLDRGTVRAARDAAMREVDPMDDIHADAAYRCDAIGTLVERVLGGFVA